MRAIAINHYGGTEQLKEIEIAMPALGEHDILIEVHATAVNPVDIAIREGYLQERISHQFPLILGWDVAGKVVAIGSDVTKFNIGDEVYSYPDLGRNGTYAEYVAVNEELASIKPKNITYLEATSVPLVGITAWKALIEIAEIQPGQHVLILGGSGGVGSLAIQLAKAMGATVSATTSTQNVDLVKGLGADFVIDYTNEQLPTLGYDVIFDTVGGYHLTQLLDSSKVSGKIVSITSVLSPESQRLVDEKGVHFSFIISEPNGESLDQISKLILEEKITPVVGKVYSLSEVSEAHQLSSSKRAKGKIVLQVKE